MKCCERLPRVWWLRGQGYISFPRFSPFYTLVFWPSIKAHPLGQGRGGHMGSTPRPSDHDGRSLQTASQCFDVLAWLSYPEPAKLQNLDIQNVSQAPSKLQEAGIAFPAFGRRSKRPSEERGLAQDAQQTKLSSPGDLSHARATLPRPLVTSFSWIVIRKAK